MRRKILLLGKILITISLIWPIPLWFVLYPVQYQISMPNWVDDSYWWLLPAMNIIGIILCLVAKYRPSTFNNPIPFRDSLTYQVFRIGLWSLAIVSSFVALVLAIMAIYYLFFTKLLTYWVPFAAPAIIFGILLWRGIRFYKSHKRHQNDTTRV